MNRHQPIECVWTGEAFRPRTRHAHAAADARFGAGEVVRLDEAHDRSRSSHDHFFAVVGDLHGTLPEDLAERFPTPDSLRHYALCKSGFCDVETFVASSKAEALRIASFARKGEVIVTVKDATVTRLTPHSQSKRAMGAKAFQASKDAVFGVIAELLGVPVGEARAA